MEQIVFITRHGDISMGIGAMKRGAVDFLPKPFRDDELLSAVAQALAVAGLVNKEIGAELGVTLRTIKAHRGRMMQKLDVLSVAELVWLAQKAGVAPAQPGIASKVPYTAHCGMA